MTQLGYKLVDFDTHYYETIDAFTAYQDSAISRAGRGVEMIMRDGRTYAAIGGRISKFVPNVTFNRVAPPGSLEAYFKGEAGGRRPSELVTSEEVRPEYQSLEARIATLASQGVEEALLLPTFAYAIEEALKDDIEAMHSTIKAFNMWLQATWSFTGPAVAAPILPLADPVLAADELERLLDAGARVLTMGPGPVRGIGDVRHSPAHRLYDPVWRRIDEAGITVAYHAADSGYFRYFKDYDDPAEFNAFSTKVRLGSLWSIDRPMQDMLGAMIMQKFFYRYPNVRIVSVEQGSDWLLVLMKKLDKAYRQRRALFAENPAETIRRHVSVCPFWEDDIDKLLDAIGVDQVVFGSDWPHPEGVAEPADFVAYLGNLAQSDVQKVMRTNARELMRRRPASRSAYNAS
ncbi:MAG: amidohydrolase family protein [Mycobacterium sp.]|uniref:amidohydrolase family protein n=1 Tax=Mycobacterium sp. TaxID=1785 RepID=UPI003C5C9A16